MTVATPNQVELAAALQVAGADGWLLYDFQGVNPVLGQVLGNHRHGQPPPVRLPAAHR